MRARDAAILGAALTVYDAVATALLPLMSDLFDQLSRMPFAPIVGWTAGSDGRWSGIGVGDLLVMTVFPLVMRKAFSREAGVAALAIASVLLAAILAFGPLSGVRTFPGHGRAGPGDCAPVRLVGPSSA